MELDALGDSAVVADIPEPIVPPPGVALLTIHSPNGTAWTITVDDTGFIQAVPVVDSAA